MSTTPQPTPNARRHVGWLVAPAAAALAIDIAFYPGTLDDAYITYRYAVHLADGHGLGAWNLDGTRVEGYSTFLFMLLLALGEKLGLAAEWFSKALGIASHLALIVLLWFSSGRGAFPGDGSPGTGRAAAAFAALNLAVGWYAVSGMETLPFALLVALALAYPPEASARSLFRYLMIAVALVLMRPEGVLFALLPAGFAWRAGGDKAARRRAWQAALGVAIAFASLTIFRLAVFGDPLPNTYYAKAKGAGLIHVLYGLRYAGQWTLAHLPWVALAAGSLFLVKREGIAALAGKRTVFLAGIFGFYFVYVIKVGGDNYAAFPHWRHFVHITAAVASLGAAGASALFTDRKRRVIAIAAALVLVNAMLLFATHRPLIRPIASLAADPQDYFAKQPSGYIAWMKRYCTRDTVISSGAAGRLPFELDAVFIDHLGLNNRHIAREGSFEPRGPQDSKTDMAYVVGRRPDFIDGYISVKDMRAGRPLEELTAYRTRMLTTLLESGIFQNEYLFVENGPYEFADRALFIRKDFWENHPLRAEIEVTPVAETVLAQGRGAN